MQAYFRLVPAELYLTINKRVKVMKDLINKLIGWYSRKFHQCFFSFDTDEFLVLKRTDKTSVFYNIQDGKKWTAFQREK